MQQSPACVSILTVVCRVAPLKGTPAQCLHTENTSILRRVIQPVHLDTTIDTFYILSHRCAAMQCDILCTPPSTGPLPCTCRDTHHFGGLNGHFHTTFLQLVPSSELCSPRWKQRKESSSSYYSWILDIDIYLLCTSHDVGSSVSPSCQVSGP